MNVPRREDMQPPRGLCKETRRPEKTWKLVSLPGNSCVFFGLLHRGSNEGGRDSRLIQGGLEKCVEICVVTWNSCVLWSSLAMEEVVMMREILVPFVVFQVESDMKSGRLKCYVHMNSVESPLSCLINIVFFCLYQSRC